MLKLFLHKAIKLCSQKSVCKVKYCLVALIMAGNCFAAQKNLDNNDIASIIAEQNLEDNKGLIRTITPAELAKLKLYKIHNELCDDIIVRIVAVEINYIDFNHKIKRGVIYVFDAIAPLVANLFNDLQKNKIPIYGVSAFDGVDILTNNNTTTLKPQSNYNYTGSFACRNSRGLNSRSMHASGMAIDFNPLQNPFLQIDEANGKITSIHPADGIKNINTKTKLRTNAKAQGFIDAKTQKIFAKHFFSTWGGNWQSPVDYHHFEFNKQLANLLKIAPLTHGKIIIELATLNNLTPSGKDGKGILKIKELFKIEANNTDPLALAELYAKSPNDFMQSIISFSSLE